TTAPIIVITSVVGLTLSGGVSILNAIEASNGFDLSGTTTGIENGQVVTVNIVNSSNVVVETFPATVTNNTWLLHIGSTDAQALGDGSYTLTADVTNAAGTPAPEATQGITVDKTAPTGGTPDLVAASDSGALSADNITNVTAPTFSIALDATVAVGDTVELLLCGSSLAHPVVHTITAADILAGSVSLTVTAGDLGTDGSKSIAAKFTDTAGNSST